MTGFSTDATKQGKMTERSVFRPYGQAVPFDKDITTPNESKGFIGERYDGDAGLQYLNARYYDPKLAMFIQPDWWEVTKAGVGTNRYSYSFDDPVNKSDGTGHEVGPGVNPAQATKDREKFLEANKGDGWVKGKAVYVKNPETGELVRLVPDVQRNSNSRVGDALGQNNVQYVEQLEYGELKGGRQDARSRMKSQSQKYAWARDGIYNSAGDYLGESSGTTYVYSPSPKSDGVLSPELTRTIGLDGHNIQEATDFDMPFRRMPTHLAEELAAGAETTRLPRLGGGRVIGTGMGVANVLGLFLMWRDFNHAMNPTCDFPSCI